MSDETPKRRWYQFSLRTEEDMKRSMWMLPIALLLVAGTQIYSAEPPGGQEASEDTAPKPDPQIAKWISQLDSDEFKVREQATQALTEAGLKSLPAVFKAIQSKQAEVRNRALGILFVLSISDDKPTANAVRTAAKDILQSQDRRRVAQARKILEYPNIHARQVFLKLGARFDEPDSIDLTETPVTDEHMVHLKWLTKLQILYLHKTSVTDAGLEHLKGLKSLHTLSLGYTKVTDAGLEHLKGLTKLQTLYLAGPKITGAGLEHLKGLTNLQYLYLADTKVTDAGLEHLKGLTKLHTLYLADTKITGAGLEHLKGLTNLQTLFLNDTKVTDAGLAHLKGLTKLHILYLTDTQVTDAGLEHLKGLRKLQILYLADTQVTDAGLEHLKGLTSLLLLVLRGSNVTDAGVKKLQQALPKCTIKR